MAIAFLATACGTPEASGPVAAPSSSTSSSTSSSAAPTSESPVAPTETAETTATTKTPDPQPAPPPPPVTVPGTPCDITEGACVRLSTNESWLISGGKISYGPVPTTSGMPGYETPVGYHSVLWKVELDYSRDFGMAEMPYSTYFVSNGIAFHEGSLTDPSHGCIHLSREAAAKYFHTLRVGDQVQVTA
ncbi:L,D-transpeptidase [Saccharothrix luteola]|uniref:L,D-transpeptidase n=1 Tax=Saccharothrix luteola TaxID=2893018 RepID=UPI001E5149FF|nr:L,D-transpeptidase [Saccharothrix luteola]MCC8245365.1 L,D-transpeptidase [Saccharothrix luteola]